MTILKIGDKEKEEIRVKFDVIEDKELAMIVKAKKESLSISREKHNLFSEIFNKFKESDTVLKQYADYDSFYDSDFGMEVDKVSGAVKILNKSELEEKGMSGIFEKVKKEVGKALGGLSVNEEEDDEEILH